jgi:5-methyltetrahydrofolate--homocysteine methyltransferase
MTMGGSNVLFGLPDRHAVNAGFLTMAIMLGVNAPISNPIKEKGTVLVARRLLGCDDFAMNYITYFRSKQA